MSYRLVSEETVGTGWRAAIYRTYRCSHCRAWLVIPQGAFSSVPKTCGKCKL